MTVATPGGILTTYDPKGIVTTRPMRDDANLDPTLQAKGAVLAPAVAQAMRAFRAAHPNAGTPTAKELLPYFETAQQGADYVEWMEEYVAAKKRL